MAVKTRRLNLGGSAALNSEREVAQHTEPVVVVTSSGCSSVKERKGLLRRLEPENLIKLMNSLSRGDQVPPIGRDSSGHLVYGAHRLTAARLLATAPKERRKVLPNKALNRDFTDQEREQLESFKTVPSVELRVDVVEDPEAEIRENTHRRQITPHLVREQLDLLVSFGYEEGSGRPTRDSKGKAMAKLAELWGVTPRALQLQLKQLDQEAPSKDDRQKPPKQRDEAEKARAKLRNALALFLDTNKGKRSQSAKEVQLQAEKLAKMLGVI